METAVRIYAADSQAWKSYTYVCSFDRKADYKGDSDRNLTLWIEVN